MSFLRRFVVRKQFVFLAIAALLFLALFPSYASKGVVYGLVNSDLDRVVEYVAGFGAASAAVFIAFVILEVVLAPVPPLVLYIAGGLLYGGFWGGTLTLIGNTFGALLAFSIARYFAHDWVRTKIDVRTYELFNRFAEKYGTWSLVLLRINPMTSTDLFSYLAGLTDMKPHSALFGTVLGLAPLVYLQSYVGADLIRKFPLFGFFFLWLSIAYFVALVAGVFFAWRRMRRSAPEAVLPKP